MTQSKVSEIMPFASDIEGLCIFSFLNSDSIIKELKIKDLATAEDISPQMEWWKKHEHDLPHWSQACRNVLFVQPSSAATRKYFSILSNDFTNRQIHSLEDYIKTSVMLQHTIACKIFY